MYIKALLRIFLYNGKFNKKDSWEIQKDRSIVKGNAKPIRHGPILLVY